jgi:CheY-specific phosphatase CheX
MSLPKSSPAGPDLAKALEAAVVEVAEQSFAAFTEICDDPKRFNELLTRATRTGADWMRATLAFSGPFHGELTVDVPEPLSLELLASCVGIDAEPGGEALPSVEDAVGELANMICGTWLTRNYGQQRFDLRPPRVDRFEAANVRRLWNDSDGALLVGFNDQPVRIRLVVV